jgi:hypothetical protein
MEWLDVGTNYVSWWGGKNQGNRPEQDYYFTGEEEPGGGKAVPLPEGSCPVASEIPVILCRAKKRRTPVGYCRLFPVELHREKKKNRFRP